MKILRTAKAMKKWRASLSSRMTLGFVPTMGGLHQGHLKLIEHSQKACRQTVVSIFVNPTQFAQGEDFGSYPRTEKNDLALLKEGKVQAVFLPRSLEELYPMEDGFRLRAPKHWSSIMEGKSRPGHFDGVSNVVLRLFLLVRPDRVFFGEKDFQQVRVIEDLIQDLQLDIKLKRVKTVRDKSGLALSTRNGYLNDVQRQEAALLAEALGSDDILTARQSLIEKGFELEYFEAWDPELKEPRKSRPSRWCIAARYKGVRLIDNLLKP